MKVSWGEIDKMKRVQVVVAVILMGFFALVLGFPAVVSLISDWWWFGSIGFEQVFVRTISTKLILGFAAGLVAFVFFYVNFRVAQRGVVPDPIVVNINAKASRVDVTSAVRRLALPGSLLLGLIVGLSTSSGWLTVLRFWNRTPFGSTDPVFGRDVGYYVFTLPALQGALLLVQSLVMLSLFMVLPLYLLRGDIVFLRNRATVEPSAQVHLGVLISILFLAAAASTYLVGIPSLVYSSTGPLFGASHTDLVARLPILKISAVIAVVCAAWVVTGALKQRLARHLIVAVAVYFGFTALIGGGVPAAVQRFIVLPNELTKEAPQLEHHIRATREAWGLADVTVKDLSGEAKLELENIRANSATIKNVRLWDREPLLQTFQQLQEIRTYYDFVSVDDDRYWIDGEYRQVLLSPRELNVASLPTRTFINERLTFTHGMGLTMSPVNQITPEGLPHLFIQDLPPKSNVSLEVTRPEIYYGELANDFVFVETGQPEFNYPGADSSMFTSYMGLGGISVNGLARKALLAARFQSLKVLLSQDITSDSRVLLYRNVRTRAAKALPFLRWDADPFIVLTDDGRLKWMLDAYTVTGRYPYSQPVAGGVNYMRNSVKVVVDAYDGDVTAYIAEPDDPIVQTYAKIYPGVLNPIEDMPADLRAHVRYPEDLFRAQTDLYAVYHMDEPDLFYHREDTWQKPTVAARETSSDPFLRHIIMKLPGESREEFIFMTPFTPRGKNNLAAWMVARNDGPNYGKLVVYRFPRQSLVFGPTQIVNRINQNTDISRQISLWDQRGSEVIRGNLLVIPIDEALVFVQAVYLRAEGGRIPELKRVVVAYENQVVMEETLDQGLTRLFGGVVETDTGVLPVDRLPTVTGVETDTPSPTSTVADLARQASESYERALEAQRAGDWAAYGVEIQRVGELLRQIRQQGG